MTQAAKDASRMSRRAALTGGAALGLGSGRAMARAHGLHVPPEEDRHEATLMMWPNSRAVYDDAGFLAQTQDTIAELANLIAGFEPVILLAAAEHHARIRRLVSSAVILWDIPTEDLWARDAGPLFAVQGGQRVISHIQFDGWGGKQVHRHDARVAERVAARLGVPLVPSGLRGEAGGVGHDGHGLLAAHESSWVEAVRNPGLSRDQIEARLLTAYGAERLIWTPGLQGQDITDYHIYSLARFTGPGQVLVNMPRHADPGDPFHRAAAATLGALQAAGLAVTVIDEPGERRIEDPDFVASYAYFYACNGAVIASEFGDPETDEAAREALARAYPGREVLMLDADALGELGGGIHCATQQIPA